MSTATGKATLTLGYSPCPNDTFILYALTHGKAGDLRPDVHLADVEELNRLAVRGELEATKLSYYAYGHVAKEYVMLASGGALGKGVGPLVVSREPLDDLSGRIVAVPGGLTTAKLLLKLSQPDDIEYRELRYDRIMPAVAAGDVDAGLIIHESRFTYRQHGLTKHLDLGEWWEATTGMLLPLGGIAAKRSLGGERLLNLEEAIRRSIAYAYGNREELEPYIARHAQEMSPEVRQQHIDLYVNRYSEDLGEEGKAAVRELLGRARERDLLPADAATSLFLTG